MCVCVCVYVEGGVGRGGEEMKIFQYVFFVLVVVVNRIPLLTVIRTVTPDD